MLLDVLIIILILMLIGVMPVWPHSRPWGTGWYPSAGLVIVVILLIVLLR